MTSIKEAIQQMAEQERRITVDPPNPNLFQSQHKPDLVGTPRETKVFTLRRAPRGEDIVSLVRDYRLQGWRMDIAKVPQSMTGPTLSSTNYTITFTKENS